MAEETVWKFRGLGDWAQSVDLDFQPGIYRFNLVQPTVGGDWGSVSLLRIVSVPKDALIEGSVRFPTQLRINRSCRVYATLDVFTVERGARWEISITKLD